MNGPTPEQMRSRAEHLAARRGADAIIAGSTSLMLRAAADKLEAMRAEMEDIRSAYRMSSAALDRFRDVVCEVAGFVSENPGDDAAISVLREQSGKTGLEPTRWRDFITGARARVDQINAGRRPLILYMTADDSSEGAS